MHVSGHQMVSQVLVVTATVRDLHIKIDLTLASKHVTIT